MLWPALRCPVLVDDFGFQVWVEGGLQLRAPAKLLNPDTPSAPIVRGPDWCCFHCGLRPGLSQLLWSGCGPPTPPCVSEERRSLL